MAESLTLSDAFNATAGLGLARKIANALGLRTLGIGLAAEKGALHLLTADDQGSWHVAGSLLRDAASFAGDLNTLAQQATRVGKIAGLAEGPLKFGAVISERIALLEDARAIIRNDKDQPSTPNKITAVQYDKYKEIVNVHLFLNGQAVAFKGMGLITLIAAEGMVDQAYDDWIESANITDPKLIEQLRPFGILNSLGFKHDSPAARREKRFFAELPDQADPRMPPSIIRMAEIKKQIEEELAAMKIQYMNKMDFLSPTNWQGKLEHEQRIKDFQTKFSSIYQDSLKNGELEKWQIMTLKSAGAKSSLPHPAAYTVTAPGLQTRL